MESTAIQTTNGKAQAGVVAEALGHWTAEDRQTIKAMVAAKATDSEFKTLLYQAHKYGLDPLLKEIWCIKYDERDAAQIFASRDGFLAIAHRNPSFDGMESDGIYDDTGRLIGAWCTVWRKDFGHPFTVKVRRDEFDRQRNNWKTMPETMLKKVAESQCLRKAFNIHGLYEPAEGRTGTEEEVIEAPAVEMPKLAGPTMWNVRDEAQEPSVKAAPVQAKDVTPPVVRAADPDTGELFDEGPAQPHPQSAPYDPDTAAKMKFIEAIVTKATKLGMGEPELVEVWYAVTGFRMASLHAYTGEHLRRIANVMQSFKSREQAANYVEERAGEKREDDSPFAGLERANLDPQKRG